MENKKMYVITKDQGAYEDHSSIVIAVTDDFEKGETYVNKWNDAYKSLSEKLDSFHKKEHKEWQLENPCPPYIAPEGLLPIPKLQSHEKVTEEMRENRQRIRLHNDELEKERREIVNEWNRDLDKFSANWFDENLTDIEKELKALDEHHLCWYIEETKWLA